MVTCTNATGRHKIPLLIIGECEKPDYLKNISRLPAYYRTHSSALMDKQIFLDWYKNIFSPKVKERNDENIKYVLLLDHAPIHPSLKVLNAINPNCKIIYFPINTTALIQPMEQGIISVLKRLYKTNLLRALFLTGRDDGAYVEKFLKKLTLFDCINSLANCWDCVNANYIKNAWDKLWYPENRIVEEVISNIEEITNMANHVIQDTDFSLLDIENWLEGDNWYPVFSYMTDEEILQDQGKDYNIETTPDDKVLSENVCTDIPSIYELNSACDVLLHWVKSKEDVNVQQLDTLYKIKNDIISLVKV